MQKLVKKFTSHCIHLEWDCFQSAMPEDLKTNKQKQKQTAFQQIDLYFTTARIGNSILRNGRGLVIQLPFQSMNSWGRGKSSILLPVAVIHKKEIYLVPVLECKCRGIVKG